ncbi:hypothetical protein GGF46_000970 [Coemansia sp. RSA 552]|nr:hypothetical protein GGF46_000970 [Coemansia sp. RSA 552]
MKFLSVITAAAAVGLTAIGVADAQQNQPRCSSVYTRKEILSLTSAEWNVYNSVTQAMQRDGWFQWFAYLHTLNFGPIHGNSQFLPFHRRFVHEWESAGRRYNTNFIQPYWDEMRDYRAPATSQVLTSSRVGGNGGGTNGCVTNGLQNGWQLTYPNNHCLRRTFSNNGNINPWYSPEYIASILQRATTMADIRPRLEFSLHGIVHIDIGGDMSARHSPNDVIFMLHHANLDRIWWQWQQAGHLWTMDGPDENANAISLDTNMPHFNEPIRSVMQLGYGSMCFQYASNPLSRRDLQAEEASRVSRSLPKDVLETWFPDFATRSDAAEEVHVAAEAPASGKEIPFPGTIPESWVRDHGFSQAEVDKVQNDARDFVSDMKKVGYRSSL